MRRDRAHAPSIPYEKREIAWTQKRRCRGSLQSCPSVAEAALQDTVHRAPRVLEDVIMDDDRSQAECFFPRAIAIRYPTQTTNRPKTRPSATCIATHRTPGIKPLVGFILYIEADETQARGLTPLRRTDRQHRRLVRDPYLDRDRRQARASVPNSKAPQCPRRAVASTRTRRARSLQRGPRPTAPH